MRRIVFVFVLIALASVPVPAHGAAGWVRPVPGRVVRPFEPPKTKYGPGHLGVDFAAAPETYVRAAGAGVVVFAGAVADTFHVVIRHANGWRTSYSFLATIGVRNGATVDAGQVIGTTGGTGEGHDGSVLHLGLRIGDEYVDPMRLFGDVDLAALVHLAPIGNDRGDERPALVVGLTPPSDDPVMCASPRGGWC